MGATIWAIFETPEQAQYAAEALDSEPYDLADPESVISVKLAKDNVRNATPGYRTQPRNGPYDIPGKDQHSEPGSKINNASYGPYRIKGGRHQKGSHPEDADEACDTIVIYSSEESDLTEKSIHGMFSDFVVLKVKVGRTKGGDIVFVKFESHD